MTSAAAPEQQRLLSVMMSSLSHRVAFFTVISKDVHLLECSFVVFPLMIYFHFFSLSLRKKFIPTFHFPLFSVCFFISHFIY